MLTLYICYLAGETCWFFCNFSPRAVRQCGNHHLHWLCGDGKFTWDLWWPSCSRVSWPRLYTVIKCAWRCPSIICYRLPASHLPSDTATKLTRFWIVLRILSLVQAEKFSLDYLSYRTSCQQTDKILLLFHAKPVPFRVACQARTEHWAGITSCCKSLIFILHAHVSIYTKIIFKLPDMKAFLIFYGSWG